MKRKLSVTFILAIILIFCFSLNTYANSYVDWDKEVIIASGTGLKPSNISSPTQQELMARQAAVIVAYQNLALSVSSIHIDATSTVENYALTDNTIKTHLQATIKNATIIEERRNHDGSYTVTMQMPLYGQNSLSYSLFNKRKEAKKEFPLPNYFNSTSSLRLENILPLESMNCHVILEPLPMSSEPAFLVADNNMGTKAYDPNFDYSNPSANTAEQTNLNSNPFSDTYNQGTNNAPVENTPAVQNTQPAYTYQTVDTAPITQSNTNNSNNPFSNAYGSETTVLPNNNADSTVNTPAQTTSKQPIEPILEENNGKPFSSSTFEIDELEGNNTTTLLNDFDFPDINKEQPLTVDQPVEAENNTVNTADNDTDMSNTVEANVPAAIVPPAPSNKPLSITTDMGAPITGLVIDTSGMNLQRSMAPKIFDETGKEIYGSVYLDDEFVLDKGIMGYAQTDESIDKINDGSSRAGKNPLVVRATSLADNGYSVKVSQKDAEKILTANQKDGFLNTCSVIVKK